MEFAAKQVAAFTPIWDLLADGVDVGLLTNFPGEGVVFTVKHGDAKTTDYSCANMHEAIAKAKETYAELVADTERDAEGYIDDEDGEIARMRWEEAQADAFAEREYGHIPPEAW